MIEAFTVAGAVLSGVNSVLIYHLIRHKDGQVAQLTAALLHTVGERQAANAVSPPPPPRKGEPTPLPQQRNQRIGLTPR